jgi:hypothetical protein
MWPAACTGRQTEAATMSKRDFDHPASPGFLIGTVRCLFGRSGLMAQ